MDGHRRPGCEFASLGVLGGKKAVKRKLREVRRRLRRSVEPRLSTIASLGTASSFTASRPRPLPALFPVRTQPTPPGVTPGLCLLWDEGRGHVPGRASPKGAGYYGLQTRPGWPKATPGSRRPARPLALRRLVQSDVAPPKMLVLLRGSKVLVNMLFQILRAYRKHTARACCHWRKAGPWTWVIILSGKEHIPFGCG